MNFPVHVAASACVGQAFIYARHCMSTDNQDSGEQNLMFATACVMASMATHLVLDAVPHNNFLYDVGHFGQHLPYVIRKALQAPKILLITLPVFLIFWRYARQYWFLLLLSLGGGLYPDIEKAAFMYTPYPRALVLFPWHSCSYSPVGWEVEYRHIVIAMETIVYAVLLITFWGLARRMRNVSHTPGELEEYLLVIGKQAQSRMALWFHRKPQHEYKNS